MIGYILCLSSSEQVREIRQLSSRIMELEVLLFNNNNGSIIFTDVAIALT